MKHGFVLFAALGLLGACTASSGENRDERLGSVQLAYEDEPPDPGDSMVLEHNLPETMACGETKDVLVRLRNTGQNTWNPNGFKLGALNGLGPFSGPTRVNLPTSVPPNGEVSFNFTLRAPAYEVSRLSSWAMVRQNTQWFGDVAEETIDVRCSGAAFDAEVVSASFPSNVECGQTFGVDTTFRNAGTTTWLPQELVGLGAVGDDDPFADATRYRIAYPVEQGDTYDFHMTFTAPPGEGDYDTDWRMVRDAGGPWFGSTLRRGIHVSCNPLVDASEVSWDLPDIVACMDHLSVRVTARNVGNTTWRSNGSQGYALRLVPNSLPLAEDIHPFPPGVAVEPGESYTFQVAMHSPASTGDYFVGFQLYNRDRHAYFGQSVQKYLHAACTPDNSRVVEETLATQVGCGRPYPVHIRMRNTGTATWTRAAGYALANRYGSHHFVPYLERVELPENVAIPPNGEYSFDFMQTAPFTSIPHLQSWVMVHGANTTFFGEGISKEVNVSCAPDVADVVTSDLPPAMACGQVYPASVTVRNMGSASWTHFFGYDLYAVGGSDPLGPPIVPMPIDVGVLPGASTTFRFDLVAPYQNGLVHTDWRMGHSGTLFGQIAERNVELSCPQWDARVVSVRSSGRESCEPEVDVIVTVRNTGTRTWGVDASVVRNRLSLTEAGAPSPFALVREVPMSEDAVVRPGEAHKFTVRVRRAESRFDFSATWWRMLVSPRSLDESPAETLVLDGTESIRGGPRYFGATARVRVPRPCDGELLSE